MLLHRLEDPLCDVWCMGIISAKTCRSVRQPRLAVASLHRPAWPIDQRSRHNISSEHFTHLSSCIEQIRAVMEPVLRLVDSRIRLCIYGIRSSLWG